MQIRLGKCNFANAEFIVQNQWSKSSSAFIKNEQTKMKKILLFLIFLANTAIMSAQSPTFEQEFPLPAMPESFENSTEQANYMVTHYWDRVNLSTAIKNRADFEIAFQRYIFQTPMASYNVSLQSIEKLIAAYSKDPKSLLTLAEIAEASLYSPDAIFNSDEMYLPFVNAVVANKKISKAEKARFQHQATLLNGCKVGAEAPDFTFLTPDGRNMKLSEVTGRHIILFVNDPDCDDCALARVRLSADPNINHFLEQGKLAVVSIYPDAPNDEWRQAVAAYNPLWIVGASEQIDDLYDTRSTPTIYYLNPARVILSKSMTVDQLLTAFHQIRN